MQLNSHFTLLHYTTGQSHIKDSDAVLNSWEDTYKSKSTCRERVKNPLAFPFYLADLARGVTPPTTASAGSKKLLQDTTPSPPSGIPPTATNVNLDTPGQVTFVLDGQLVTIDLTQAGNNNMGDLGLIDVTASNAKDAFTQSPLDSAASIRFHDGGYVEIIRTTFYVGDRARFFFLAGANCYRDCANENCDGPMDITYKITFTNGYEWNNKHFSADEIGVVDTMWTFITLQFGLFCFFTYVRWQLRKVSKYHHTVKMLGASIVLALLAHIAFTLHYFWYAQDGIGHPTFMFIGRLIQGASETVFLLVLIMLAKGWTICCRKISARGRVKIAVFGTVYSCVWIAVPVGYYFYSDKASTLHIYQSIWGYFLCALRGFGLLWFWYSSYVTLKKFNAKVHFYRKFIAAFTLWFVGLPITVGVATALDPWVRFLVVNALDYSFLYLFQLVLLLMYNPSTMFNKSFPFHATTLDAMSNSRPKMLMRKNAVPGGGGGGDEQDDSSGAGAHGGESTMKSFGNTVFQKNILSSKWDQNDFAKAMHHARVLMREGELLMQCLESIEASNEDEDEAYDLPSNNSYGLSPSLPRPPGGGGMFGGRGMGASLRARMTGGGGGGGGGSTSEPRPVSGGTMGVGNQPQAGFQAPTRVFGNDGQPQPSPQQQQFGGGGFGGGEEDEEGGFGSQALGSNRSLMSRMGSKSKGGRSSGYT